MSSLIAAVQVTTQTLDAAPVEAAAQAAPAATQAAGGDLDMLQLVLHASLPVQIVMVLLLLASIASWVIIIRKKKVLDRALDEADSFEERFWSGGSLSSLHEEASRHQEGGMEAIFEAGYREFHKSRNRRGSEDGRLQLEAAQRAMRATASREIDGLEQNLEFLANVGSISPYIGLFGTVWGIMISFQGLANVKEATIATVAPGISEALIATAMGLFAAIPAVWAYNRYATKVERVSVKYDAFSEEFSSILQRQAQAD